MIPSFCRDGRQIEVRHVGPLISQQPGYGEMGVQRRHAAADERCVLFGGVGMPQSMESNAPARYDRGTDSITVAEDELLHSIDGPVGGDAQFFVVRQRIAGIGHLIVEKSDGGEVGFDGAGGLALLLQIKNIAHQMLAAELGCGRLRRCPVIRPATDLRIYDTPYDRHRTLTAAYRGGSLPLP